MPPRKKVPPLGTLATSSCVLLIRTASVSLGDDGLEQHVRLAFRSTFTDKLPATAKDWLLSCLNRRFGPHAVLAALDILLAAPASASGAGRRRRGQISCGTKLILFERGLVEEKLWLDDVMALHKVMDRYNIGEQLTEISLAVKFDRLTERQYVPFFNLAFPKLVTRMAALVSFTMIGACDDRVLASLGRHCPNLRTVDVSESWQVTGTGVLGLLFASSSSTAGNDDESAASLMSDDDVLDIASASSSSSRMTIPSQQPANSSSSSSLTPGCQPSLNPCVRHLTIVNIKDTDVNSRAVEALLKFAPSLTSVGGFFYHDNIGSCICNLRASTAAADAEGQARLLPTLMMEDLYDVSLTEQVVKVVDECCPHLRKVATRGHCLPHLRHLATAGIEELSVDFDFHDHSGVMEEFLWNKGYNLTSLETSDQPVAIDISIIQETCPNIKAILGRFTGQLSENVLSLTSARVITDSVATATSILRHAVNLKTLVLKALSWPYGSERGKIGDNHLLMLAHQQHHITLADDANNHQHHSSSSSSSSNNESCLQQLEHLMIQEPADITGKGLQFLANNCPQLTLVGQLRNFSLSGRQRRAAPPAGHDVNTTKEDLASSEACWQRVQQEANFDNLDLTFVPFCDDSLHININRLLLGRM